MKRAIFIVVAIVLVACDTGVKYRGGEFRDMRTCLRTIESDSGYKIGEVITDKPNFVSGYLENDMHFTCKKKESGTRGVFFEGVYQVSEESSQEKKQ